MSLVDMSYPGLTPDGGRWVYISGVGFICFLLHGLGSANTLIGVKANVFHAFFVSIPQLKTEAAENPQE